MNELSFAIQKIIDTANDLLEHGSTPASTGEQIAAALVLNRKDLLPDGYTIAGAWLALTPQWKQYVLDIQRQQRQSKPPRRMRHSAKADHWFWDGIKY